MWGHFFYFCIQVRVVAAFLKIMAKTSSSSTLIKLLNVLCTTNIRAVCCFLPYMEFGAVSCLAIHDYRSCFLCTVLFHIEIGAVRQVNTLLLKKLKSNYHRFHRFIYLSKHSLELLEPVGFVRTRRSWGENVKKSLVATR